MGRWLVRGVVGLALLGALATVGRSISCDLLRLDVQAGRLRDVAACRGQPPLVEALAQLQRAAPAELLDVQTWDDRRQALDHWIEEIERHLPRPR